MKNNTPSHIGFIPDGNRRWAKGHDLSESSGYAFGIQPGLQLFERCQEIGIQEITIYGFTKDNVKRPSAQKAAFSAACVAFCIELAKRDAAMVVIGDDASPQFPVELKQYRLRHGTGMKVNLLANYDWEWDLAGMKNGGLRSHQASRVDLIVRWGGGRRLSGFLPVQSVYADFYVRDEYWPDFELTQFEQALLWYKQQDKTLGG